MDWYQDLCLSTLMEVQFEICLRTHRSRGKFILLEIVSVADVQPS